MKEKRDAGSPIKTISVVMIITLAGKLLGLIRDRLLTVNYGIGMETNAFLTASLIPRVFFDTIFASAISASFIPIFSDIISKKGKKSALEFSNAFITLISLFSFLLTLLGMLFARELVFLFADGYGAETAALCIKLTRLMFPTVFFTGIAYCFVGILHSFDEFNVPALISVVSNAVIIVYFFTLNWKFGIFGLAAAFLLGWFTQAFIQIPSLKKRGFRFRPSFNFRSEGIKRVLVLMLPIMVSTWVQPINLMINSKFGSRLFDGSGVSAIELSNNLYIIIAGVFILSVTNVIFPKLSRLNAEGNLAAFGDTVKKTVRSSLYFIVPMTAGVMILSKPLIALIYGGGQFDEFSIDLTSRALFFVSLGMPGYALSTVFGRVYFSRQRGMIPLLAGGASVGVNILLCALLIGKYDVTGLALASAAAATVNALIMLIPLQKSDKIITKKFILDFTKILISCAFMAVCAVALTAALGDVSGIAGKIISIAVPAAAGAAVYIGITLALRLDEAVAIKNYIFKFIDVNRR